VNREEGLRQACEAFTRTMGVRVTTTSNKGATFRTGVEAVYDLAFGNGRQHAYIAALKAVGLPAVAQAVAYRGGNEEEMILEAFADVAKNMRRLAERGPVCLSFEPSVVVADRIKALERERDVAQAWAAWWKAKRDLDHASEYGTHIDEQAIWPAVNAAEEALLQLGINPNTDES
jgi:hypothetical protein